MRRAARVFLEKVMGRERRGCVHEL
jgi:hypothetical protein